MKLRLRKVPRIRDTLKPYTEEQLRSIFPLSPSTVNWDFFGGCSWRRFENKVIHAGERAVMPDYVFRGALVDEAVQVYLNALLLGEELDEGAVLARVFEVYHEKVDEYLETDENAFPKQCASLALTVVRELQKRGVQPLMVQPKLWLYIGDEADVEEHTGDDTPTPAHDWVLGFADLVERVDLGAAVRDLKVTTRPIKSKNSGVGKFKLQCFTYCSALYQRGYTVTEAGLIQQDPRQPAPLHEVDELFTMKDYDRTVRIYRAARDHYLSVLRGEVDPSIPYLGQGACTERCQYFASCEFGRGRLQV